MAGFHPESIQYSEFVNSSQETEEAWQTNKALVENNVESSTAVNYISTANQPVNHASGSLGPYFRDCERRVDMVLVYLEVLDEDVVCRGVRRNLERKRWKYITELQKNGLQIEMETRRDDENVLVRFIKLHATLDTLKRKAEEMRVRLAFAVQDRNFSVHGTRDYFPFERHGYRRLISRKKKKNDIIDRSSRRHLLARFSERHGEKFLEKGGHFCTVDRIRIVQHILNETRFSEKRDNFGIRTLLYEKVFNGAYPVHDGSCDINEDQEATNDRQKLSLTWATFRKFYKEQPLDLVNVYFGTAIGFYFAWLGFVVQMLFPVTVLGFLVLVYGVMSVSVGSPPLSEICNQGKRSEFVMCPQCDKHCWYWNLSDICATAKVAHWLDNDSTVLFAVLVSVWSTMLTVIWKRRQAKLAFEWQTYHFDRDDDPIRPEYDATVSTVRRNIATGRLEKYVPHSTLGMKYGVVIAAVFFMITVALATVVGVVVYRGAVYTVLVTRGGHGLDYDARIVTGVTAGLLNLITINILSSVYRLMAHKLTDWENPRTQNQWENSFTCKIFAYEFVNMYSSIFYLAFFRNNLFIGTPGHYVRFAGSHGKPGYRLESCGPSGCLVEVFILLTVIMVGQLVLDNIIEIVKPFFTKWRTLRKIQSRLNSMPLWELDYHLPASDETLFWEYLEIVLQLGFVMMFSAAFPLAPFFALINGLVEIRLDAIKFIKGQRRALPQVVADIGAWQSIVECLSEISVLVNCLVIAFTSEFIPKLVYRLSYSPDGTLHGYVNSSLSFYNISWFPEYEGPDSSLIYGNGNPAPQLCRYRGYRETSRSQRHSLKFWHITAIQFAFVFAFYSIISLLKKMFEWMISDEQEDVKLQRKKAIYMIKKLFTDDEEFPTVSVDAA